jgi:hypothetical protein
MTCPVTQRTQSFLAVWPPHEEDSWLARAVEIRAKELNAPSARELPEFLLSTAVQLRDCLKRISVPATWHMCPRRAEVEGMLHESTYPRRNWERLTTGYVGDVLPEGPPSDEPFDQWTLLISCFARSLVGVHVRLRETGLELV